MHIQLVSTVLDSTPLPDPFDELKQKLEAYHANGYASGFEESDIALRTEPKLSLPTARSIIAIAVGYPTN